MILKIARDFKDLSENPIEGIKMILNDEDMTDIQAVLSGPGTL